MVKVGLIGAGFIGQVHARSLSKLSEASLEMVYDINVESSQRIAKEYEAKVADSFETIIKHCDAIVLAVPTDVRHTYLEKAFKTGKPILCEKPLARTVEEGEWILRNVKSTHCIFTVGHVVRFFPEYVNIRNQVLKGKVGDVCEVRSFRGGPLPDWSSWFKSFKRSGGSILDLAIHDIDFWIWVLGKVKKVSARSLDRSENITKDHCYVLLSFENGALVHIEATWAYPPNSPFRTSVELTGSKGSISFNSIDFSPLSVYIEEKSFTESPAYLDPYAKVMKSFVNSVIKNSEPEVTVEDAFRSLEIACLALKSAQKESECLVEGKV